LLVGGGGRSLRTIEIWYYVLKAEPELLEVRKWRGMKAEQK